MKKFDELFNKIIAESMATQDIKGFVEPEYLKPYEIEKLHKFIEKNKLVYNKQTDKWDCDHNIDIYRDVKWEVCVQGGYSLGIKFGVVKGKFLIGTDWLNTLYGSPTRVEGDYVVLGESQISNFYGAPEYVGGNFKADSCGVTSTKGLPKYIGGNLEITHCNNLFKIIIDPETVIGGNISFVGCSRASHTHEFYYALQTALPKSFKGDIILPNRHKYSADLIRSGNFSDPSWC